MEPLILYFVLFFPGIYSNGINSDGIYSDGIRKLNEIAETIPFSIVSELGRTLTYTIPSLALLWYIFPDKKGFSSLKQEKLQKRDFLPFAIGLPGLILIGLGISFLVSFFYLRYGLALPARVEAPASLLGWIVIVFSCMGTGYLEESYFRCYLLTKLEKQQPKVSIRIIFSTILFSLCHIFEGPWGIINAALAGLFLSWLYDRFRSLHGVAWAHGAYNIFVYFIGGVV
jgi:membrane protease YdiL (CAAX protease family)